MDFPNLDASSRVTSAVNCRKIESGTTASTVSSIPIAGSANLLMAGGTEIR